MQQQKTETALEENKKHSTVGGILSGSIWSCGILYGYHITGLQSCLWVAVNSSYSELVTVNFL